MTIDKVVRSAAEAVADIGSGSSIAVGGFGLSGIPTTLIDAVLAQGAGDLRIVSNNCGVDHGGLGLLLEHGRISRVIASYVGENKEFARRYLSGEVTVELSSQGTLAERLRAGGAGIGAFFTPTGAGTLVAEGGLPWRYHADGSVALASPPKEVRDFNGTPMVLEEAITTDYALVRVAVADKAGNCVFRGTAQNFNRVAATAGRITIVEAESVVEAGAIPPNEVDLQAIYVGRNTIDSSGWKPSRWGMAATSSSGECMESLMPFKCAGRDARLGVAYGPVLARVCDRRSLLYVGRGLGALCFAKARNRHLTPATPEVSIVAGQRPLSPLAAAGRTDPQSRVTSPVCSR